MEKNASELIYLLNCIIHEQSLDLGKITSLERVLKLCDIHSIIPYVYNYLKNAGVKEIDKYADYINQNLAKIAMQDFYREQVSEKLSSLSVPHVFLKGKDVCKFLPENIMRFSCDVDVYYPEEHRKIVDKAMRELGFVKKNTEEINDFYFLPPLVSFETHFKADNFHGEAFSDFSRFEKKGEYLYQMIDEDIYLYYLVHTAKHFKVAGIGLRALVDLYFIKNKVNLESEYVKEFLELTNLSQFNYHILKLIDILFEGAEKEEFYEKLFDFIYKSATFGSERNKTLLQSKDDLDVETATKKQLRRRIFPPYKSMKIAYPSLKKFPILLPFYWVWRLGTALVFKRKKVKSELKTIKSIEVREIEENNELLKKLNLY